MGCEHLGNIQMPLWIWNIGGAIATYKHTNFPGPSLGGYPYQIVSLVCSFRNKNTKEQEQQHQLHHHHQPPPQVQQIQQIQQQQQQQQPIPSDAGIDVNFRYKALHLAPNSFFTWCPDPPNATFLQEILFLPSWKWKTTQNIPTKLLLLEIHPFSTEPWLWEECYSAFLRGSSTIPRNQSSIFSDDGLRVSNHLRNA